MKRKNGFTLIELVVVIALIAILAVTLAPRLRDQIAKGNDAKSIALLGSMRTASEIYFADNGETVAAANSMTTYGLITSGIMDDLKEGLDNSALALINDSDVSDLAVPIGGRRANAGDALQYGGEISFTFATPDSSSTSSDGISIWFTGAKAAATGTTTAGTDKNDTKDLAWASY